MRQIGIIIILFYSMLSWSQIDHRNIDNDLIESAVERFLARLPAENSRVLEVRLFADFLYDYKIELLDSIEIRHPEGAQYDDCEWLFTINLWSNIPSIEKNPPLFTSKYKDHILFIYNNSSNLFDKSSQRKGYKKFLKKLEKSSLFTKGSGLPPSWIIKVNRQVQKAYIVESPVRMSFQ